MAFLTALLVDNQLKFAMVGLVASLAGVQSVANIRHRGDMARAAFWCSVANVLVILVAHGATVRFDWRELGIGAAWGVSGGLGSVLLFWLRRRGCWSLARVCRRSACAPSSLPWLGCKRLSLWQRCCSQS